MMNLGSSAPLEIVPNCRLVYSTVAPAMKQTVAKKSLSTADVTPSVTRQLPNQSPIVLDYSRWSIPYRDAFL